MGDVARMPTTEELAGTIMSLRMDARIFTDSPKYMAKVADIYGLKMSDIFIAHYKKALEWIQVQANRFHDTVVNAFGGYTGLTMTFGADENDPV